MVFLPRILGLFSLVKNRVSAIFNYDLLLYLFS